MKKYRPIIKTTQSELTAIEKLSDGVKDKIFPIFELTRSRATKNLPEGDIAKSYIKIISAYPDRDFILDLTSHEDLTNSEIEALLDDSNGYAAWCNYIESLKNKHVIPCIQIIADDPARFGEITKQVKRLSTLSESVAIRVGYDDYEIGTFLDYILKGIDPKRLVLVLDAGYIRPSQTASVSQEVSASVNEILAKISGPTACVASSSFPRTVNQTGYGGDEYGLFALEEVMLHKALIVNFKGVKWVHADYASIHPNRYETKGGAWVPRIDVPLKEKLFFYRYRREDGGYRKAAQSVKLDSMYAEVSPSWGKEQIEKCASGGSVGQSPSFWISVRANIHITTQTLRVEKN